MDADDLVLRHQAISDNSAEPQRIVLLEVSFPNSWLLTHMYLHLDYRNMITLYQLRLFSTSDLKYAGTNDYTCNCPCIQQLCTLSHQSVVWMLMALRISIWVAATAVVSVPELSHQVYLNGLYWDKSANSYVMPLGYTEYQVICFLNDVWYPLSTRMLVSDSTLLTTHVHHIMCLYSGCCWPEPRHQGISTYNARCWTWGNNNQIITCLHHLPTMGD